MFLYIWGLVRMYDEPWDNSCSSRNKLKRTKKEALLGLENESRDTILSRYTYWQLSIFASKKQRATNIEPKYTD